MRIAFGLCVISLLFGCGTKKKVVLQPQNQPIVVSDSFKVKADTVKAPAIQVPVHSEDGLIPSADLTISENVRLMMMEGMNKEVDRADAMHYDVRKPSYVIIHHTAQTSINQTIRTFQLPHTKVSAHYVIGRDGRVVQMLNDYLRAWHAGRSKWGNISDINSISLGIELDNNGKEPFSDAQISALLTLLETLRAKYQIPMTNFIGHADIAPMRKDDPSVLFPWKRLAEHGFGVWYDESNLAPLPADFNYVDALRIVGYDVSNLPATIRAFKRKFIVVDVNSVMTEYDKRVLFNLYRRYF